jgi:activator of HSP90 ATPase
MEQIMSLAVDPVPALHRINRRQLIAGVAISAASLAGSPNLRAMPSTQAISEKPAPSANPTRTSLHQETDFKAAPARIYDILLDSKQFAACTGMPAGIDPTAGGAFNMFGGMIVGRNIELTPRLRIVQAWRPTHWRPGIYSIARFEFRSNGAGSTVILDHSSFPEGDFDSLSDGWKSHYWQPLAKFLA